VSDIGNRAGGASRADGIIVGGTSAGGVLDVGQLDRQSDRVECRRHHPRFSRMSHSTWHRPALDTPSGRSSFRP
jgi:hypothetical protein